MSSDMAKKDHIWKCDKSFWKKDQVSQWFPDHAKLSQREQGVPTVWKSKDFSTTWILREIKFDRFTGVIILTVLETLDLCELKTDFTKKVWVVEKLFVSYSLL